jgi:uncharacterized glyoxalase superfamily protein PhnB
MDANPKPVECIPFILVDNIGDTIEWYQRIGFECPATNQIWEPDCALNWATIEWEGAGFMIGPDERRNRSGKKDSSLWFNVESVDPIVRLLEEAQVTFETEEATFYGRKVISFKDVNGFTVSFSSSLKKADQFKTVN